MFPLSTSTTANCVRLTACLLFFAPATLSGQATPVQPLRQREVIEDLSPETLARVAATYAQRQHYSSAAVPAPVIPLQLAQAPLPASQILPLPSPAASVAPPESSSLHLVQSPAETLPRVKFPYTAKEKLRLAGKDIVDPFNLMAENFNALYYHAQMQPYRYGGGAEGYGKRLRALVASDVVGEFTGT